MTRRLNVAPRPLAAVVVLLLALAACGGADEPEAATETEPAVTTTETTEPLATETTEPMATETTEATDATATDEATEPTATTATEGGDGAAAMTADDVATALEDADLMSVAAAVQAAGLDDQLAALPSFTVFAPSDEALATLGADIATMDVEEVQSLLAYHATEERLLSSDITGETTVDTLAGSPLTVSAEGGTITVGDAGATVTQADITVGDSGVIHVIDQVLEPTA